MRMHNLYPSRVQFIKEFALLQESHVADLAGGGAHIAMQVMESSGKYINR